MEKQTFKPNNTLWTALIVLYVIAAVIYTLIIHDSIIRLDALFMNPLLAILFIYAIRSRKVIIDTTSIRYKILGLTPFTIPMQDINRLQLGDSLLAGRWLRIEYIDHTGKTKRVHITRGFDLKDIYERLANQMNR